MSSRIQSFTDKDPELNRKLVQLEESLYSLLAAAADDVKLELPAIVLAGGFVARAGQLVRVGKVVELLLAAPTVASTGTPLVIWNRSGGTVTLRPIKGLINGAATASLAGARAYRLQHDGTDYCGEF